MLCLLLPGPLFLDANTAVYAPVSIRIALGNKRRGKVVERMNQLGPCARREQRGNLGRLHATPEDRGQKNWRHWPRVCRVQK
jgi:hypothetical protein